MYLLEKLNLNSLFICLWVLLFLEQINFKTPFMFKLMVEHCYLQIPIWFPFPFFIVLYSLLVLNNNQALIMLWESLENTWGNDLNLPLSLHPCNGCIKLNTPPHSFQVQLFLPQKIHLLTYIDIFLDFPLNFCPDLNIIF